MNWLHEFLKTAAPTQPGPASLSGAAATSITPPPNPVQQIAQQRAAVAQGDGTPVGNPEVMKAEQAAAEAQQAAQQQTMQSEQQSQQQVAQMQQQLQAQTMKSQQDIATLTNKAHTEAETLKADVRKHQAEAELAKVESAKAVAMSEIGAARKEHEAKTQVSETALAGQTRDAQTVPLLEGLSQRLERAAGGAPDAAPDAPAKPKAKAKTKAASAPPAPGVLPPYSALPPKLMGPPAPDQGFTSVQDLQTQGFSNPGGGIFMSANYRPSFGALGDKLVSGLLPAAYGQPDWGQLFQRHHATNGPGFDPQQLAQGFGVDLARNLM